eukprot:scaffold46648_cov42-Prasinocladus_malaysianus.AAC.1
MQDWVFGPVVLDPDTISNPDAVVVKQADASVAVVAVLGPHRLPDVAVGAVPAVRVGIVRCGWDVDVRDSNLRLIVRAFVSSGIGLKAAFTMHFVRGVCIPAT